MIGGIGVTCANASRAPRQFSDRRGARLLRSVCQTDAVVLPAGWLPLAPAGHVLTHFGYLAAGHAELAFKRAAGQRVAARTDAA